jgi:transposase
MSYRKDVRTQQTLFPSSIDEYISSDDPVRVYDALVESLDVIGLGLKLNDLAVGNSSYHPVTMLKILIYAYSYGYRSSRKIEITLHHNLSFIWLAENLKPDHKTISKFSKDHKLVLKKKILLHCASDVCKARDDSRE